MIRIGCIGAGRRGEISKLARRPTMRHYELTDKQFALVADLLPPNGQRRAVA